MDTGKYYIIFWNNFSNSTFAVDQLYAEKTGMLSGVFASDSEAIYEKLVEKVDCRAALAMTGQSWINN